MGWHLHLWETSIFLYSQDTIKCVHQCFCNNSEQHTDATCVMSGGLRCPSTLHVDFLSGALSAKPVESSLEKGTCGGVATAEGAAEGFVTSHT